MELSDIQGLLVRGHGDLPAAAYVILQITDPAGARSWLREMHPAITPGSEKPPGFRLQLAFTHSGLERMMPAGVAPEGFLVEFVQGMAAPFRSRVLGDIGGSDPDTWKWGGPQNEAVHLAVLVFAESEEVLAQKLKDLEQGWVLQGLKEIIRLDTSLNPFGKEHFGFRDGLTQPIMPGLSKKGAPENTVAVGEFILGYPNGYDQLPPSPHLPSEQDPNGILPTHPEKEDSVDFGKNGSYLVFRQLEQDVAGFWEQAREAAQQLGQPEDVASSIFLASKMVGRWPNGKPLCQAPEESAPADLDEAYFLYRDHQDEQGHKCPLGAHVRRTNPRDVLPDNNPEASIRISNLHRILRRGRNFGPPLDDSFDPVLMQSSPDDGQERGLHFLCFNTNIARQFEFVQHMWCNNPKFNGLYEDPDPVLGITDHRYPEKTHDFTIQAAPLRKKIRGMRRHVKVLGGAYFFMPGLKALNFLAQQPD